MTDSGIREQLARFADSASDHNHRELMRLAAEHPDIAKEVLLEPGPGYDSSHNRLDMINLLFDQDDGEEVALFEAQRLASRMAGQFDRCMPRVGRMVKNWLACKTDELPTEWPTMRILPDYFNRAQAYIVCRMSKYNEYMARSLVYAIHTGYTSFFREPLKCMLELWGLDYTKRFLEDMTERYQVDEADIMEMYSAGSVLPWRTKLETQLYEDHIRRWIETDWEKYLEVMTTFKNRGGDLGKKAYKKIIRPRLDNEQTGQ